MRKYRKMYRFWINVSASIKKSRSDPNELESNTFLIVFSLGLFRTFFPSRCNYNSSIQFRPAQL